MLKSAGWDLGGWFRSMLCHKLHQSKSLRSRFFNGFNCPSKWAFKCHRNPGQFSLPHKEKCDKNILPETGNCEHKYNVLIYSNITALPKVGEIAESHGLLCSKCENTNIFVLSQAIDIYAAMSIKRCKYYIVCM